MQERQKLVYKSSGQLARGRGGILNRLVDETGLRGCGHLQSGRYEDGNGPLAPAQIRSTHILIDLHCVCYCFWHWRQLSCSWPIVRRNERRWEDGGSWMEDGAGRVEQKRERAVGQQVQTRCGAFSFQNAGNWHCASDSYPLFPRRWSPDDQPN